MYFDFNTTFVKERKYWIGEQKDFFVFQQKKIHIQPFFLWLFGETRWIRKVMVFSTLSIVGFISLKVITK